MFTSVSSRPQGVTPPDPAGEGAHHHVVPISVNHQISAVQIRNHHLRCRRNCGIALIICGILLTAGGAALLAFWIRSFRHYIAGRIIYRGFGPSLCVAGIVMFAVGVSLIVKYRKMINTPFQQGAPMVMPTTHVTNTNYGFQPDIVQSTDARSGWPHPGPLPSPLYPGAAGHSLYGPPPPGLGSHDPPPLYEETLKAPPVSEDSPPPYRRVVEDSSTLGADYDNGVQGNVGSRASCGDRRRGVLENCVSRPDQGQAAISRPDQGQAGVIGSGQGQTAISRSDAG